MTLLAGLALAAAIAVAVIAAVYLRKRPADAPRRGGGKPGSSPEVGQTLTLSAPILAGRGRIIVDGREWLLDGPDLDAGTTVTIVAEQEGRLFVAPEEPAARLPKAGTFGG
jgi:membrane protein implicated in regulation of membrane protease activity